MRLSNKEFCDEQIKLMKLRHKLGQKAEKEQAVSKKPWDTP